MTISNRTLVQIAAWGALIVSSTGMYLQHKLVDRCRGYDYYQNALKKLRTHPGAVLYLGEPIKDRRFKLSDSVNNFSDGASARFCVPVTGPKDKGFYYFWAERSNEEWILTKAELELKSKPESRLIIMNLFSETDSMNMFIGTSKEKFFYHNTLLCLVKTLQGRSITLDLRNDSSICGKIDSVDGFMNISFNNAVYYDPQGNEFQFDNLFIQGRNIRYLHIPENVPILATIKNELSRQKKPEPMKKATAKSRKAKKALQLHMETVASLETK